MEARREQGSYTQAPLNFARLFEAKGFTVLDPNGQKIGKVDDVYVGKDRQPRYLGVKMGLLGAKMTVIPVQLVKQVDLNEQTLHLTAPKDVAKSGPVFDRDHVFMPEDEVEIWNHYGLGKPVYTVTEIILWKEAS
jgi:hypothetical protein